MSLINQMLQELDARGAPAAMGGVLQGNVRAVPKQRGFHPAWWLVLMLACVLIGGSLWVGLGRSAPETAAASGAAKTLPLKIDIELGRLPAPPVEMAGGWQPDQVTAPVPVVAAPVTVTSEPGLAATVIASAPATSQPLAINASMSGNAQSVASQASGARPAPPVAPAIPLSAAPAAQSASETTAAVLPSPSRNIVIAKQVRELTPQQHAENEYRKASNLIQQGRTTDAFAALEHALRLDARHAGARQTLVALLIESRRQDVALRVLREGLQLDAGQTGLAMILARMQLERGELKPALSTLQRSLPHAAERADYQAFLAALLQRDGRHREAVEHYAIALRMTPENGLWWMGQAISLQAENRTPEAIAAYNRAKAGNGLSAELRAFVDEKLNSL